MTSTPVLTIAGVESIVHLSRIPAHKVIVTVAPFQAWRSSQLFIARGPR